MAMTDVDVASAPNAAADTTDCWSKKHVDMHN
jgi:hypothetical protein